jgi:hypothetical protein
MKETRLESSLSELVAEGALSEEQAELVFSRFVDSANRQTRKSIFAEIGGYLGGAFVVIAVMIFIVDRFDNTSVALRSSLFALLSIAVGTISYILGTSTPVRARLASVLAMASAASATGSIAILMDSNQAPVRAFVLGAVVATFFFYRNRTEILHLGCYGYLFITSLMTAATIMNDNEDASAFKLASIFWIALASVWIYLIGKRSIHELLGYFLASATLFFSVQSLFVRDLHHISYLLSIAVAFVLARLYLSERSWPLLGGAVLTLSISAAEFVASTLGGSIGAIVGLFVAGVALTSASLYSIRSQHHE